MDSSHELLSFYLEGVRLLTGAESTSLFVPATTQDECHTILIHEGEGAPIHELVNLPSAFIFAEEVAQATDEQLDKRRSKLLPALRESADAIRSQSPGGILLPLLLGHGTHPLATLGQRPVDTSSEPRRRSTDADSISLASHQPAAWLGLRFHSEGPAAMEPVVANAADTPDSFEPWRWILSLGGAISRYLVRVRSVLHDSLTGLPGPAELYQALEELTQSIPPRQEPLALLMINPRDFGRINDDLGRQTGDRILQQLAQTISRNLRLTDFLARFGGAVFAVILANVDGREAKQIVTRVLQHATLNTRADEGIDLELRCGLSLYNLEEPADPQVLVQQAAQALRKCKTVNQESVWCWSPTDTVDHTEMDPLTSILTGDMARDYQRMSLMWETVSAVASQQQPQGIIDNLVESLHTTYRPDQIGVFLDVPPAGLTQVRSLVYTEPHRTDEPQPLELQPTEAELSMIKTAANHGRIVGTEIGGLTGAAGSTKNQTLAVPITAGDETLGCLYLARESTQHWLDISDVLFLQGLASQLGVALHRVQLARQERTRQEEEGRRLRARFDELRAVVGQTKLVYRSPVMTELLSSARNAAQTDATILITGESGTGKGVLAQTIHNLSNRRDQPFVVVDCSAMSSSLIDNELFGHVRGAYTGAEGPSIGRLAESDKGTVFIDEIAELPLEVQGKLLTFVQDRKITPVGASRSREVDVRIVAASNRDLEAEVASGRFRGDLYYRLNVVNFHLPPLRERQEEIPLLTRYFIEHFSLQYQKRFVGLSHEAEAAVRAYDWPGNIRELQNKVLRAVVLCPGEELQLNELGLDPEASRADSDQQYPSAEPTSKVAASPDDLSPNEGTPENATGVNNPVESLRELLTVEVTRLVGAFPSPPVPVAKWLDEGLLETAHERALDQARTQSGSVIRRTARLLGLAESTCRRKLREMQDHRDHRSGLQRQFTARLEPYFATLVDRNHGRNLLKECKDILCDAVRSELPGDTRNGALIMATTAQTFRKWCMRS